MEQNEKGQARTLPGNCKRQLNRAASLPTPAPLYLWRAKQVSHLFWGPEIFAKRIFWLSWERSQAS